MVARPLAGATKAILIGHDVADLTLYLLGNGESKSCKQAMLRTSMHFRRRHSDFRRKEILADSKIEGPKTSREVVKANQARHVMLRP